MIEDSGSLFNSQFYYKLLLGLSISYSYIQPFTRLRGFAHEPFVTKFIKKLLPAPDFVEIPLNPKIFLFVLCRSLFV